MRRTNRLRHRFAIVVSRFNQNITQRLLRGALNSFRKQGFDPAFIPVYWVPGAFEIPVLALKLAKGISYPQSKKFDAIVCLGCVLQGKTPQNRYIAEAVAQGLQFASLTSGLPITFGILTPKTIQQAFKRSENNSANKGSEAAEAAIEMAKIMKRL